MRALLESLEYVTSTGARPSYDSFRAVCSDVRLVRNRSYTGMVWCKRLCKSVVLRTMLGESRPSWMDTHPGTYREHRLVVLPAYQGPRIPDRGGRRKRIPSTKALNVLSIAGCRVGILRHANFVCDARTGKPMSLPKVPDLSSSTPSAAEERIDRKTGS